MEPFIKNAAYSVALLAEFIAVVIILFGVLKTVFYYAREMFPFDFKPQLVSKLRMLLGSSLSLSLEFLIGADILKTAISPTWNELGMLGAIVVIRTVLNFFLMQEMSAVGTSEDKS